MALGAMLDRIEAAEPVPDPAARWDELFAQSSGLRAAGTAAMKGDAEVGVMRMTRAGRFFHRWQAWAQGIAYALVIAKRVRVRAELVLELECPDEDGHECRLSRARVPWLACDAWTGRMDPASSARVLG